MDVRIATQAANPDRPNEDFVVATPEVVILLDGAGSAGAEAGCVHSVAWYVNQLGPRILARLTASTADLGTTLAEAIIEVNAAHVDTCDLTHPGTPSATVVVLRDTGERLDYLVLADSVLVLDTAEGVRTVCDTREATVGATIRSGMDTAPNGTPEHDRALRAYIEAMRQHRNRTGGFWVAAVDPDAAAEALTGSLPRETVRAACLLSDGASRYVDRFRLGTWRDALDITAQHGPAELISRVRAAEASDPTGARWPRGKTYDDATAAHVRP